MSHFIKIMTELREREHLVQALRDLHHQFREGQDLLVRGYSGKQAQAEIVVDTGSEYDIGFQRKTQGYEMVADWWGVEGRSTIKRETFVQQVSRQYAYNVIRDQMREQNLILEVEQAQSNGDLVMVYSERG